MASTQNNSDIRHDLIVIAKLNERVRSEDKNSLKLILSYIQNNKPFQTVFGERYQTRIQQVILGEPYDKKCIMCGKLLDKNIALCEECERAIINGKKKTQQTINKKNEELKGLVKNSISSNEETKDNNSNTNASRSIKSKNEAKDEVQKKDYQNERNNPNIDNNSRKSGRKRKKTRWVIIILVLFVIGFFYKKYNDTKKEAESPATVAQNEVNTPSSGNSEKDNANDHLSGGTNFAHNNVEPDSFLSTLQQIAQQDFQATGQNHSISYKFLGSQDAFKYGSNSELVRIDGYTALNYIELWNGIQEDIQIQFVIDENGFIKYCSIMSRKNPVPEITLEWMALLSCYITRAANPDLDATTAHNIALDSTEIGPKTGKCIEVGDYIYTGDMWNGSFIIQTKDFYLMKWDNKTYRNSVIKKTY